MNHTQLFKTLIIAAVAVITTGRCTLYAQTITAGTLNDNVALFGEMLSYNEDSTLMYGYEMKTKTSAGTTYAVHTYDLATLALTETDEIILPGQVSYTYSSGGKNFMVGKTPAKGGSYQLFATMQDPKSAAKSVKYFGKIPENYFYMRAHLFSETTKQHYFVFGSDISLKGKTDLVIITFDNYFEEIDRMGLEFPEYKKGLFLFDCALNKTGTALAVLLAPVEALKDHTNSAGGATTLLLLTYTAPGQKNITKIEFDGAVIASPLIVTELTIAPFVTGLNKTDDTNELLVACLSNDLTSVLEKKKISLILPEGSLEYTCLEEVSQNADSSIRYTIASTSFVPKCIACLESDFRFRWSHGLPDMPDNNFMLFPGLVTDPTGVSQGDSVHFVYVEHKSMIAKIDWIDNAAAIGSDKNLPYLGIVHLTISVSSGEGHARYYTPPAAGSGQNCIGVPAFIFLSENRILARAVYNSKKVNSTRLISIPR